MWVYLYGSVPYHTDKVILPYKFLQHALLFVKTNKQTNKNNNTYKYKEYCANNFLRFMKFLLKQYLSISLTSEIGSILYSTPAHQATIIPSSQLLFFFFKALIITSIMISKTSVLAFHLQCFLYLNILRRLLKSVCFKNYIIPPARSLF